METNEISQELARAPETKDKNGRILLVFFTSAPQAGRSSCSKWGQSRSFLLFVRDDEVLLLRDAARVQQRVQPFPDADYSSVVDMVLILSLGPQVCSGGGRPRVYWKPNSSRLYSGGVHQVLI